MKLAWPVELVQLAVIAAMFGLAAACWPFAPEQIPVHWNLHGEVDRYGGKFTGLVLLPLVTLGLYALLLALPRIDPFKANYASFAGTYRALRVALVLLMAGIYAVTLAAAFELPVDVGMCVSLGVAALFVVIGLAMPRLRPNWFVGVRTPWTLSSRVSWEKTHRLAGGIFLALGPLLAIAGILKSGWFLGGVIAVAVAGALGLVAYSYFAYRADPNRTTPFGLRPPGD